MNPTRFDRISTFFATRRLTRRHALAAAGTGLAAAGLTTTGLHDATAQDATSEATPAVTVEKTMYLFVQSFQSGSIAPTEGTDGRYTVTLEQGLGQTIYFADRPSRDVGTTPTPQFLESLGFPEDNPPNAALLLEIAPGETDIAVVELFNPTYDPTTRGVTYDVAVLENWEDTVEFGFSEAPADLATLAPTFGSAHLFIDDCANQTVYCVAADTGTYVAQFDNQPFCWYYPYSLCMPCEPFGNTQPGPCSTAYHWGTKCIYAYPDACGPNGCWTFFSSPIVSSEC